MKKAEIINVIETLESKSYEAFRLSSRKYGKDDELTGNLKNKWCGYYELKQIINGEYNTENVLDGIEMVIRMLSE